jgi:hypothetical protein
MWPIGRLRPNLFIYAQLIIIFVMTLSQIPHQKTKRYLSLLVIVFILVRIFHTNYSQLANLSPPKEESDLVFSDFSKNGKLEKLLNEQCQKNHKIVVLLNPASSHAREYFYFNDSKFHFVVNNNSDCLTFMPIPDAYSNLGKVSEIINGISKEVNEIWLVYSHLSDAEINALMNEALKNGSLDCKANYIGAGYFRLHRNFF